ncbi:MAG: glutathione peroxidase [Armatimonadetes bacterium]|jgi:glutathione peroxidase|nr:glutathione peroxidase [Armatimonadota bacterium]
MKSILTFALACILLPSVVAGPAKETKPEPLLSGFVKDVNGRKVELSKYKGKVLLIVNTASKCGNTPQYAGLEAIYRKYKDKGFVVLAFPANDFGRQEPGTDSEILQFCTSTYNVTFPVFSKISVKDPNKAPLYRKLTDPASKTGGEIEWNFAKFLVNRKGEVVARFPAGMKPETPAITSAIEKELAVKR